MIKGPVPSSDHTYFSEKTREKMAAAIASYEKILRRVENLEVGDHVINATSPTHGGMPLTGTVEDLTMSVDDEGAGIVTVVISTDDSQTEHSYMFRADERVEISPPTSKTTASLDGGGSRGKMDLAKNVLEAHAILDTASLAPPSSKNMTLSERLQHFVNDVNEALFTLKQLADAGLAENESLKGQLERSSQVINDLQSKRREWRQKATSLAEEVNILREMRQEAERQSGLEGQ